MAENIEFISAAELPITEAEEVDVLCVENGELKRKAGGSAEYDVVVEVSYGIVSGVSGYSYFDPVLVSGDFSTLMAKIKSGEVVNGVVRLTNTIDHNNLCTMPIICATNADNDIYVKLYYSHIGNGNQCVRLDSSMAITIG